MKPFFLGLALSVGAIAFAAPQTAVETSERQAVSQERGSVSRPNGAANQGTLEASESLTTGSAPSGKLYFGDFETRPSYGVGAGYFHTENNVELGVNPARDMQFSLSQDFNANLSKPQSDAFTIKDLFARAKFNNLWANRSGLSFSYEPRLYAPTDAGRRSSGFITMVRNYLKLKQVVSPLLTVTFMDVPVAHFYNRASAVTENYQGATETWASPIFENKFILNADVNLTDKLTFSLPLMFEATRRTQATGAKYSGSWTYFVWTMPELDYAITSNATVGISYYTNNLMSDDLSVTNIANGINSGVAQFVLRASL